MEMSSSVTVFAVRKYRQVKVSSPMPRPSMFFRYSIKLLTLGRRKHSHPMNTTRVVYTQPTAGNHRRLCRRLNRGVRSMTHRTP